MVPLRNATTAVLFLRRRSGGRKRAAVVQPNVSTSPGGTETLGSGDVRRTGVLLGRGFLFRSQTQRRK